MVLSLGCNYAETQTWVDIARMRSETEIKEGKEVLLSIAYNLTYIEKQTAFELIDIEKTIADTYIIESINQDAKIFEGKSFNDLMNEYMLEYLKMNTKLEKDELAAGLDSATNANGLFTYILNFKPVGEDVGSALSVANNFLEEQGIFTFTQKVYAPSSEKHINKFHEGLSSYLLFYNNLYDIIERYKNSYITFQPVLLSDSKELNNLLIKYEAERNKLLESNINPQDNLISYIQRISTTNISAPQYMDFINNEPLQNLIKISKQIKEKEKYMSRNYLSLKKSELNSIDNLKSLLDTSSVTLKKQSRELKKIINALDSATITISSQVTTLEDIIEEK